MQNLQGECKGPGYEDSPKRLCVHFSSGPVACGEGCGGGCGGGKCGQGCGGGWWILLFSSHLTEGQHGHQTQTGLFLCFRFLKNISSWTW